MKTHFTKSCMRQFRIILLIIVVMITMSCATVLKPLDEHSFDLDNTNSIIFGKAEFVLDGQILDYKGTSLLLENSIIHHISRYTSDEKISQNKWAPGEYSFGVTGDSKGYFAFALPPGKYYFVELIYRGIIPDVKGGLALRTYMPILGGVVKKPYLITFDVPPNSAVYIGTIIHEFKTAEKSSVPFKAAYEINVVEDFENAKKWFLRSRGKVDGRIIENIAIRSPYLYNLR
jgi:hypothetical protein